MPNYIPSINNLNELIIDFEDLAFMLKYKSLYSYNMALTICKAIELTSSNQAEFKNYLSNQLYLNKFKMHEDYKKFFKNDYIIMSDLIIQKLIDIFNTPIKIKEKNNYNYNYYICRLYEVIDFNQIKCSNTNQFFLYHYCKNRLSEFDLNINLLDYDYSLILDDQNYEKYCQLDPIKSLDDLNEIAMPFMINSQLELTEENIKNNETIIKNQINFVSPLIKSQQQIEKELSLKLDKYNKDIVKAKQNLINIANNL